MVDEEQVSTPGYFESGHQGGGKSSPYLPIPTLPSSYANALYLRLKRTPCKDKRLREAYEPALHQFPRLGTVVTTGSTQGIHKIWFSADVLRLLRVYIVGSR